MAGTFELKSTAAGKFHFNLKAGNGEIILASQQYEARSGAEDGIDSVRRNAPIDERFERKASKAGEPFFVLTAANGQTIGLSEMYSSALAMENGIELVKRNAPGAILEDWTSSLNAAREHLPLRALVAIAARCARRVRTIYREPNERHQLAVDLAIDLAERFAAGDTNVGTVEATEAAEAAREALFQSDADPASSGSIAAAMHAADAVAHAAGDAEGAKVAVAVQDAAAATDEAVSEVPGADLSNPAAWKAAEDDCQKLLRLDLGSFGDLGEPIDTSEAGPLGPVWPEGAPTWLPGPQVPILKPTLSGDIGPQSPTEAELIVRDASGDVDLKDEFSLSR